MPPAKEQHPWVLGQGVQGVFSTNAAGMGVQSSTRLQSGNWLWICYPGSRREVWLSSAELRELCISPSLPPAWQRAMSQLGMPGTGYLCAPSLRAGSV